MVSFSKLKELYPENWGRISRMYKESRNFTCESCGKKYPPNTKWLHVHHIVSLSKGGSSDFSNLKLLCYQCHKAVHAHMGKRSSNGNKGFSKKFEL